MRQILFAATLAAALLLVSCSSTTTSVPEDPNVTLSDTSNLPFPEGSQEVTIHEPDYGPAVGYHAHPVGQEDVPGVLLIHEWWGLNKHIKATAKKLASHGYSVLAVDLYNGSTATSSGEAARLSGSVDGDAVLRNLRAGKAYLREQGSATTASFGFCFGGDQSMRFAYDEQRPDASIIFYGQPEVNESRLSRIDQPVLGVFGTNDSVVSVEEARSLDESLDNTTKNEFQYYEDAEHAFANPSGDSFNEEAASRAWNKTLEFLDESLESNR